MAEALVLVEGIDGRVEVERRVGCGDSPGSVSVDVVRTCCIR